MKDKITTGFIDADLVNDVSIIEVAQELGLNLKKRGGSYFIICPFHNDKKETNCSLIYNSRKNMFKCFNCGEGGPVVKLVMQVLGCDFKDALKWVAVKFNLPTQTTIEIDNIKNSRLSPSEYKLFDLKNAYSIDIINYSEEELDIPEVTISKDKYTLSELYNDDPELHDEILLGKFFEKLTEYINAYAYVSENKDLPYVSEPKYKPLFLNVILDKMKELKELLYKGLSNKDLYNNILKEEIKVS